MGDNSSMFGSMSWQIPFADWAASSIKIAEKRSKSKKYKENNNNWIAKNIIKKIQTPCTWVFKLLW